MVKEEDNKTASQKGKGKAAGKKGGGKGKGKGRGEAAGPAKKQRATGAAGERPSKMQRTK